MLSILPYQRGDAVQWRGQDGSVVEVKGERVVVETIDGMVRITTQDKLREQQASVSRRAS